MSKNYLIIGTSAAGIAAAHKLRQLDSSCTITCFTQEKESSYNKCLLADFLSNSLPYPTFKSTTFFDDNNIGLKTNCRITFIDARNKNIYDTQGHSYSYDALLLAVGGNIIRPETTTSSCVNVFDFYTFEQTAALKTYAQKDDVKTIIIIGAGLSGLECADALCNLNKKIVIIEKAERALAYQITADASQFLHTALKENNIELIVNTYAQDFGMYDNMVHTVVLANGQTLQADMVIYALGARANNALAQSAGLKIENGAVVVDEYLKTSNDSIWAAGDICRVYNTLTASYIKSCTWPDAMQQGMYAAHSMAGIIKPYKGAAPVISSHFFGMKFFVAGRITTDHLEDEVIKDQSDKHYTFIILNKGVIKGFILFGDNKLFFALKHSLITQTIYNP